MAILPRSGRAAIAKAIKNQSIHLAWGLGDGAWTNPPAEDALATELIDEIGRREAVEVAYVVPNESGNITIEGAGTFSRTETPTNQLFLSFKFDAANAPTAIIREIGVFAGTVTTPGLPAGQKYFVPSEISDPGTLLQLEHKTPIYRAANTRESFDILITF
jgi:hypothetical protein